MKSLTLIILSSFFSLFSLAQNIQLRGKVIDSNTKQAVDFATVALIDPAGNKTVKSTLTDAEGVFKLSGLSAGTYSLKISFIGFKPFGKEIQLSESNVNPDLGMIALIASDKALKEVSVSGEKSVYQQNLDKRIINVDKNLVTSGGTAADVLATIPGMGSDGDGNMQMRGTSNLNILIDGKPTGSRANNLQQFLEQIPASSIENIEVLSNPSAKYDPSGSGGIINIVLKRNKREGLSGSLGGTIGLRQKFNGNAALNYKMKWFNLSTNFSFQSNQNLFRSEYNSLNFPTDTTFRQYNLTNGRNRNTSYVPKLGMDFYISDHDILSLNGGLTVNRNKDFNRVIRQFKDEEDIVRTASFRYANTDFEGMFGDATLSYKHMFPQERHTLSMDFTYQRNNEKSPLIAREDYMPVDLMGYSSFSSFDSVIAVSHSQNFNIQADYVRPLRKSSYLEAGYSGRINYQDRKLQFFSMNTDSSIWGLDKNKSNRFIYDENIQAVYTTFNGNFGKLSYKFGLRLEGTFTHGKLITTGEDFRQRYFSAFPSFTVNHESEKNLSFRFSYSRRINRPNSSQLNPFGDYSDPRNVRTGNPALKPEFIHSFETGLDKSWKKITFSATLYYRLQTNMMTFVRKVDDRGFGILTFQNLGTTHNYGVEFSTRYNPFKWWSLNLDLNGGGQTFDDSRFGNLLFKQNWSFGGNLLTNFTIKKIWNIQLTYNYRSPSRFPQGTMKAMQYCDLAMKISFFKGNLSFTFRVADIFNTRRFAVRSQGVNFDNSFYRQRDTRNVFFGINYRFGRQDKASQNRRREGQEGQGGMEMF